MYEVEKLLKSKKLIFDPLAIYFRNRLYEFEKIDLNDVTIELQKSRASITKWCKKLGFNGWLEFRNFVMHSIKNPITTQISDDNIVDDFSAQYKFIIEQETKIEKLAKSIVSEKVIYLYGVGGCLPIIQMIKYRLQKFGLVGQMIDGNYENAQAFSSGNPIIYVSTSVYPVSKKLDLSLSANADNVFLWTANRDNFDIRLNDDQCVYILNQDNISSHIEINNYLGFELLIWILCNKIAQLVGTDMYERKIPISLY